jgi:hypothetical protein
MSIVTITEEPLAFEDLLEIVDGARVELADSTRAVIAATAPNKHALGGGTDAALRLVEEAIAVADPQPDAVHRALRERFPVRRVGASVATGQSAAP